MARIFGSLVLIAVLGFGLWPYFTLFRIDAAMARTEAAALAPYVDLPAVQQAYKARLGGAVQGFVPRGDSDGERVVAWLAQNLLRIGDSALDQALTVDWVRGMLRTAAEQATDKRPADLLSAVDFAFFESWNRFVIRLGPIGADTNVVLTLTGAGWRVTDIVR